MTVAVGATSTGTSSCRSDGLRTRDRLPPWRAPSRDATCTGPCSPDRPGRVGKCSLHPSRPQRRHAPDHPRVLSWTATAASLPFVTPTTAGTTETPAGIGPWGPCSSSRPPGGTGPAMATATAGQTRTTFSTPRSGRPVNGVGGTTWLSHATGAGRVLPQPFVELRTLGARLDGRLPDRPPDSAGRAWSIASPAAQLSPRRPPPWPARGRSRRGATRPVHCGPKRDRRPSPSPSAPGSPTPTPSVTASPTPSGSSPPPDTSPTPTP